MSDTVATRILYTIVVNRGRHALRGLMLQHPTYPFGVKAPPVESNEA